MEIIDKYISYSEFYEEFIKKNKPCLFGESFTKYWKSRKNWVKDGKVNVAFLKDNYGHLDAPVVDCCKQYFSSHEKCDMKVIDFFEYWNNRGEKLLYLKDWHLQRIAHDFYDVPLYFTSDWLNEYFDYLNTDDYRFVYIGVKGTWTPFHADVFHSFSWSANICGLKKWIFYPPGEEEFLKDKFGKLPFDVTNKVDPSSYPNSTKAAKPIEILQKEGEIIFVPSGWHHQVINLEDTISINHNCINAGCIEKMFTYVSSELECVKVEIDDCKLMEGFSEQCQLILNASLGINYSGFYKMIVFLIQKRLRVAEQVKSTFTEDKKDFFDILFISSSPNDSNIIEDITISNKIKYLNYDLTILKTVLESLLINNDFKSIAPIESLNEGDTLLKKLGCLVFI